MFADKADEREQLLENKLAQLQEELQRLEAENHDLLEENKHLKKHREFTFTVDDGDIHCGLNGATYFVQMNNDGGKSKSSKYSDLSGAMYGTGTVMLNAPTT